MPSATTTSAKLRQSQCVSRRSKTAGSVQATRSISTRARGGKTRRASTPLAVKDGRDAALFVAAPEIPQGRTLQPGPVAHLGERITVIECQQRARAIGDALDELAVHEEVLQPASVPRPQTPRARLTPAHTTRSNNHIRSFTAPTALRQYLQKLLLQSTSWSPATQRRHRTVHAVRQLHVRKLILVAHRALESRQLRLE